MVCTSLYLLLRYASRVYTRFRLPQDMVVTGRFDGAETRGVGAPPGSENAELQNLSHLISTEQQQLAQAMGD